MPETFPERFARRQAERERQRVAEKAAVKAKAAARVVEPTPPPVVAKRTVRRLAKRPMGTHGANYARHVADLVEVHGPVETARRLGVKAQSVYHRLRYYGLMDSLTAWRSAP